MALITDAPKVLRAVIHAWLISDGNIQARQSISTAVEALEFTANAHTTHGEVELYPMMCELSKIAWPEEVDIYIIEIEKTDDAECVRVVASMPLDLHVNVPVEMSFSFWDSVDHESITMGGRDILAAEQMNVRASLTLLVYNFGTEDAEIEIEQGEIEGHYHEIDLGEVDMFDPDEYYGSEDKIKNY